MTTLELNSMSCKGCLKMQLIIQMFSQSTFVKDFNHVNLISITISICLSIAAYMI